MTTTSTIPAALTREAWVQIDLGALAHNFKVIRERVGPDIRLICVVKAEAYGHGAVECSRALVRAGADMLAVATFDEFMQLRQAGIKAPLLLLGHIPEHCYEEALREGAVFTLYSARQAVLLDAAAGRAGCLAQVHVKADSGLSRLGFSADEAGAGECALACSLPNIRCQAVASHLAIADSLDKEYTFFQHGNFLQFIWLCGKQGLRFPWRHLANSAAICDLPALWHEGARPGIILFGGYPSATVERLDLQPVMSVRARVVNLRSIAAGTKVSYGCIWEARRASRIALLPIGYADGLNRRLNNQMQVLIHGQRAPQLGFICMDQIMVDVTDVPGVELGDEAVILGRQGEDEISMDEIAGRVPTINYEILCGFRARLPYVYKED